MDVAKKIEELGTGFEEFKKAHNAEIAALKTKGFVPAEVQEKQAKIDKDLTDLQSKVTELGTALNRKGNAGEENEEKQLTAKNKKGWEDYNRAMNKFMAKGVNIPQELLDFHKKEMSVDSDENGGFLVSPEVSSEISKVINETSPIRQNASVQSISSDALEMIWDGDRGSVGWVGERQARVETDTPELKKIVFPAHEIYAMPKATQKILDDASINLESWLGGKVAEDFTLEENYQFINGNGVNKPKGILAYASGTGFDQVERVPTAANNALTGDDLIDLQMALKEGYQAQARWMMNRMFLKIVRKLKDSVTGQYLWQPGLQAGMPATILGNPVDMAADLPSSLVATTDSIIYGDIKKGYQIVDRIGIRVLRDPYTVKGAVMFYTTKRVGGGVKNFEAIKVLRIKT